MTQRFQVACVQNCAGSDMERNLAECEDLIRAAAAAGAALVCLPEYFARMAPDDRELVAGATPEERHPAIPWGSKLAQELGIWLLLGSIAVRVSEDKVSNRSYLIDASGAVVATYDKIHLFDVSLRDGESYRESASVHAGNRVVTAPTPWGKLGFTICYDVRFPYLHRRLAREGALYITAPAAFTRTTGQAHWHVLQRSRAIETGCYVFAPGQCGVRSWGRATYGHSLIVDPWGEILADAGTEPGYIIAEVDPARVEQARGMIPSLQHHREL